MKKNIYILYKFLIFLSVSFFSQDIIGQAGQCLTGGCTNVTTAGSGTTFTTTSTTFVTAVSGSTFRYYNFSVTSGTTYEWSLCSADGGVSSGDNQFTLRNTANTTTYCYSDDLCGSAPKIMWTATFTGTVRLCLSVYNCATTVTAGNTIRWRVVPSGGYNPCSPTAGTLSCNTNVTASFTAGQNAYNPPSTTCGFSTPGQERIYTFTATTTGGHTITQASSSVGYVDYFFKPVSGGCSGTGWTCIDDLTGASTSVAFNLTAGTQYYILADPEASSTGTAVFQVTCPSPPVCATYTSPADGATGVDPSLVSLVWAAAAGATSYDIYFGTAATPPLFTNTTATSFNITGMVANTTYYWQIRPKNANGTATGCAIRSFTTGNTVNMQNLTNGAAYMCSGNFYDSGGSGAAYTNNENRTVTFYPATAGQMVQLTFSLWDVENTYEFIRIYDGTSTAAPQITTLPTTGTVSPAPVLSASNASGALTINFTSDVSVANAGWAAAVSCCLPPTSPAAGTFGTNQWNVYCYKGNNLNLSGVTYKGYYTESSQSFDTGTRWSASGTPSSASGYSGCAVEYDYHTVVSKRQGFTPGHYSLSIPTHDDDIRVYINGTQVFEHVGCCDAHNNFWCGYLDGTSTIEVRHAEGVGGSQQALTFTSTGDPTVYGTNQWNIYTYTGYNPTTYYGYATNTTSTEFNIGAFGMGATSNPSTLPGYIGCNPGDDNWSFSAKRQGFPCATYNVNLAGHDDEYILNIDFDGNGTVDFTSTAGCCNNGLGTKWTGVLSTNSRVEIVLKEGGGDAYVDIDFVNVTAALQGGTIAGISDGVTICNGADPGAFTNAAAASAGSSAAITGGTSTYQWESSTTNGTTGFTSISGQTSATYDPATLTQTTWFRRRVTDACGTVAYSNVIQVVVIPYPTGGSIATVLTCAGATATVSITGATNATQYSWVLPAGFTGSSTTSSITVTAASPTTQTNYTITAYPQNVSGGATCTGTAVNGTVTVRPLPQVSSFASATGGTSICNGDIGQLVVTTSNGTGPFTVVYNNGTSNQTVSGVVSGTAFNASPNPTSGTTTYTLVSVTDANGCVRTTGFTDGSASITVRQLPTATISGTTTVCQGATSPNITFTGTAPGGTIPPYTFTYNINGGANQTVTTTSGSSVTVAVPTGSTGTFTYNLVSVAFASNPACTNPASGSATVTVNPNHTLSLTSAPATTSQTVCNGVAITNITYSVGGGATSAGVTGLPSGVSGNFSGGTLTISGIPTQDGAFTYTVTSTGNSCPSQILTGTITVRSLIDWANLQWPPNGTICPSGTFDVYGQVYEPGVTPAAGQGSGLTAEIGYSTSNTNPNTWTTWTTAPYFGQAGTGNNNDEFKYTFSGLAPGTYYYAFRYSLNGCAYQYGGYSGSGGGFWDGTTNVSGVLTVQPNHTISLTSAAPTTTQTVCQGTGLTNIVYAVGGGGTSAGVTGLPTGVTGSFASGNFTISGTPTQSGTFSYTVTTTGNGCTVATATGTITVHAPLVLTPGGTNVSCNGGTNGTASVTASGGTGTYTYSWYSGGSGSSLSGLGIGTYTVLVTSGACSAITSYTVTQPSAITGSASAGASILCNGGTTTLTATASGGTGALQYSLNGGAYQSSNSFTVGAGTHTITVKDANNCTQTLAAVVVSQPSALVAKTCTNANDLCQVALGQIKVEVSGGVAPYNVAWSPTHGTPSSPQSIGASGGSITISGLQGGVTYNFVVTDANGCVAP